MTTDCDWPPSDHLGDLRPIVCLIEEMIVQWRSGARRPVEEYLARLPGITDDDAIELVFVEVLLRRELGEAATADDYVARFPRLAELLRAQFDRSGPALVEPTELEPSLQRAADGTAGAIRESLGESRGLRLGKSPGRRRPGFTSAPHDQIERDRSAVDRAHRGRRRHERRDLGHRQRQKCPDPPLVA